jgi:atypical dual specificity phosphatase
MGTGGVFLRKVRAKVSDRPTGFVWVKDHVLAASGLPASRRQLEWLSRSGIKSILTLTELPLPDSWKRGLPLTFAHVPMRDHEPPSVESLDSAVSFLEAEVRGGRPVLVHCLAGQGRTMCAIACYLIREEGADPSDAIKELRTLRSGAVEPGQEKALWDFANSNHKPAR